MTHLRRRLCRGRERATRARSRAVCHCYRRDVYRSLSLYPTSADPAQVEELVERTAAAFKQSPGFRSATTSVDALMGPGARDGEVGRVVVVDFDTLDDALSALKAETFQETRTATEVLGATLFLFECREV
jgi:hypothetical protein